MVSITSSRLPDVGVLNALAARPSVVRL